MWSYGRTSKFFRLDGLLLFGIIMRLLSASSAMITSSKTTIITNSTCAAAEAKSAWAHFSKYLMVYNSKIKELT